MATRLELIPETQVPLEVRSDATKRIELLLNEVPEIQRLHSNESDLEARMAQKLQVYCENLRLSPKRES